MYSYLMSINVECVNMTDPILRDVSWNYSLGNVYGMNYSFFFFIAAKSSRLFGNAPEDVLDTLANSASTANIHEMCLTEANFTNSRLSEFYDITTTSIDDAGLTFISSVEAKNYPFWGVQFHPEKVLYEWLKPTIPHSAGAVDASQYFADFFINQGSSLFPCLFFPGHNVDLLMLLPEKK